MGQESFRTRNCTRDISILSNLQNEINDKKNFDPKISQDSSESECEVACDLVQTLLIERNNHSSISQK